MHDPMRSDPDVVARTPRGETQGPTFWERWILLSLSAGLTLLLAVAVTLTMLVSGSSGTAGDYDVPDGYGVTPKQTSQRAAPSSVRGRRASPVSVAYRATHLNVVAESSDTKDMSKSRTLSSRMRRPDRLESGRKG